MEDAAPDGLVSDQAEEPFDQIDPSGRGRGEVDVKARMALGQGFDLDMFMGGVIVDDQMQIEVPWACRGRLRAGNGEL